MGKVVTALLVAAVALYALKVAILLLFLAGIIFRTKETLGLILVLGVLALFRNYPIACVVIAVVAAGIALAKLNANDGQEPSERSPEHSNDTST